MVDAPGTALLRPAFQIISHCQPWAPAWRSSEPTLTFTFWASLPSVVPSGGQRVVAGSEVLGAAGTVLVLGFFWAEVIVIWETSSVNRGWVKMDERMFLISVYSFIWSCFYLALSGLDLT